MWTEGSTRIVLAGAKGAGKSRLLDAVAASGGVAIASNGSTRWIETTTSRRRYMFADAVDALIPSAHAVVLVVAVADGPMPGTRRHFDAARGVGACVVYLDDRDIDDVELTELVEMEMRDTAMVIGYHIVPQFIRAGGDRSKHVMGGVGALAALLDAM